MTAQQLAERCKELGAPIHRSTITKIENGRPRFDLGELMVLAAALGAPPLALLLPADPLADVEVLPGLTVSTGEFVGWFTGDAGLPGVDIDQAAGQNLILVRQLNELNQQIAMLRHSLLLAEHPLRDVEAVPQWRERMKADVEHYREMLDNARRNRADILKVLSGDDNIPDGSL